MFKIQSIVDNTRKYLEGCIFRGELHPGQQIKEQDVASFLGISRPPVREALKLLEAEGLIIRKPNRGAFVSRINEKDAWEIYTLKMNLYTLATQLAFEKITDAAVRKWEEVVDEMERCVGAEPPDIVKYQRLNQRFHDIMIDISGHERLRKIVLILHNQARRFSCKSLTDRGHLIESLTYHKAILEAIRSRDMALTIKLSDEHILKGLEIVQRFISEERESPTPLEGGQRLKYGERRIA